MSEEELDGIITKVERMIERVLAKLPWPAQPERLELLDLKLTAKLLKVEERWLYKHAHELPFTVKLPGSRLIRFSVSGIEKYIKQEERIQTALHRKRTQ
jgi:hypothetical protein